MRKIIICLSVLSCSLFYVFARFDCKAAEPYSKVNGVSIYDDCGKIALTKDNLKSNPKIDSIEVQKGNTYRLIDVFTVCSQNVDHPNQPRFVFSIEDFGLSKQKLYYHGYETFVVIFQFTMREIYDGYQEIHLRDYSSSNKNELVKPITKFEYDKGSSEFSRFEFYAEFKASKLTGPQIEISFASNGWWYNDWLVTNIRVEFCLSHDKPIYNDLLVVKSPILDPLFSYID